MSYITAYCTRRNITCTVHIGVSTRDRVSNRLNVVQRRLKNDYINVVLNPRPPSYGRRRQPVARVVRISDTVESEQLSMAKKQRRRAWFLSYRYSKRFAKYRYPVISEDCPWRHIEFSRVTDRNFTIFSSVSFGYIVCVVLELKRDA